MCRSRCLLGGAEPEARGGVGQARAGVIRARGFAGAPAGGRLPRRAADKDVALLGFMCSRGAHLPLRAWTDPFCERC